MAEESYNSGNGSSNGSGVSWLWIIVIAILVVLAAWVGSALYYEYRQDQQIMEIQNSATAAAEDASAEAAETQQGLIDGLDARLQELEDRVGSLGDSSPSMSNGATGTP